MPKTKRGIYHNLKESRYTVSNGETVFFFSSEMYMNNFLECYKDHREKFLLKVEVSELNMETLADIKLYERVEKRGFRACLKAIDISSKELHKYALRKMMEKATTDWIKVGRPKITERLKEIGEHIAK